MLERKRFVAADLALETPKIYYLYESYESILLISGYQTYHLRVSYNYETIDWLHNSPVPIEDVQFGLLCIFCLCSFNASGSNGVLMEFGPVPIFVEDHVGRGGQTTPHESRFLEKTYDIRRTDMLHYVFCVGFGLREFSACPTFNGFVSYPLSAPVIYPLWGSVLLNGTRGTTYYGPSKTNHHLQKGSIGA